MSTLSFLGATGLVTGSRFLLELNDRKLLIDCGLFQGRKENRLKNWDAFPIPPGEIDRVLLTHAHIDHTGYLPRLFRDGFSGKVHCTYATRELCDILLKDSAHLQMEDAAWANKKGFSKHKPAKPLYRVKDAERVMELFEPLNYGENFYLHDDLRIKFKDAGHILGSSFVEIKTRNGADSRKLLFSGDLGRPERPILRDPVQVFNVDYLVLESTYGARLHSDSRFPQDDLARVINKSVERGGVLVIPAFAVGRTQSLLYDIRELEQLGKIPTLPVYLDSPMAVDATEVFERRKGDYDLQAKILEISGQQILRPGKLHITRKPAESKAIREVKREAIIISASGMLTGGRILHHMAQRLPHAHNTILFIGYQAEGTRGRTILDGKSEVKMHGQYVPVRAHIETLSGYSGHADYNEILAWLMGFNKPPAKTFLVHGEPEAAKSLQGKIESHFGWQVEIPEYGQSFELDL